MIKVFGIGLSRTGTSSLNAALSQLGYRSIHFPWDPTTRVEIVRFLAQSGDSLTLSLLESCDALTDTPVACVYQALDAGYPGSKFILTVRDETTWLKSCEAYWAQAPWREGTDLKSRLRATLRRRRYRGTNYFIYVAAIHDYLYGTRTFNADRFIESRRIYEDGVRNYFSDRPESLLVLDICAGAGWEPLCAFLDRPVPSERFPLVNALTTTAGDRPNASQR